MKRNVYLNMKPLEQARKTFLEAFDWTALAGNETVATVDALGRVTACPVFARYSSPAYHASAMDGVALLARDTFGADDDHPVRLDEGENVWYVNTGQPLPTHTDSVVMIEQVHRPEDGVVELRAPAFPWQHVRRLGEDMVASELMFPHHHRITAADQAALMQAGVFELEVLQIPRVAVIPTGHELLKWEEVRDNPPRSGEIIETNSTFLAGMVTEAGAQPIIHPLQPDDPEALTKAVEAALDSDAHMVITNAGASAGSKDYSVHVLGKLGEVLVHGITVMPGKPTILGQAKDKPVVGSPGYAVSAWVCFDQFVIPALHLMQGKTPPERIKLEVTPARPLPSKLGQEEFLRVHLGRVGDHIVATPLKRGAGTITSLTRADGLLRIPENSEGLGQGEKAEAELLVPPDAVEKTLVIVGSHDVTLDILADAMARRSPGMRVSSSHLGSMAALMALKEGRSHLGGTHLLDTDTGEYNVSYLKRYLKGIPVRLVTLAQREQGFMVAPGNPKSIKSLKDLARPEIRFINRQAGSGTRVLLDHHLGLVGLSSVQVNGYDNEEFTHMAVAAAVLSGGADVGLGILAAAKALGLDFVPVASERYDLCIPQAYLDDPRIVCLLETLEDGDFRKAVKALGGYDISPMGQIAWEG